MNFEDIDWQWVIIIIIGIIFFIRGAYRQWKKFEDEDERS